MMHYEMMSYGMAWAGLIYFALGAFIFSVIFWLTYNWLVKKKIKILTQAVRYRQQRR